MNRNKRAEAAQETLRIIEQGYYQAPGGRRIDLQADIDKALEDTLYYREDAFGTVLEQVKTKAADLTFKTEIAVRNTGALEAAAKMAATGAPTGCLNFASAKNPGGGFLGGAQAQEESLALSSALYPTLMKHFEMYTYNRARSTYLYADHMIYSPGVPVFRDDNGALLTQPYRLSFVTSPAINIGAMQQNNPAELAFARETMLRRMDKVLSLFVYHGIEHVVLGAWGCGVFKNDPRDIAAHFASFLKPGGKYSTCFKSVVFAIHGAADSPNSTAFKQAFDYPQ
ncbi:TIGR02452 family protein [Taibaiella chishuiensis]|uniref:Uncharacterized protein (TIGR02452 family) n=1 Tax=Taibaiella chishuiensis TaxID=1434707 RepID=A0A2P8DAR8_9BACT|nr:TIGR02452 family protein [Taibaiella chishuiensis]PSK94312.1 uncharacterized protein (TIGR02452 family) [Taibaiella chishuiensis]